MDVLQSSTMHTGVEAKNEPQSSEPQQPRHDAQGEERNVQPQQQKKKTPDDAKVCKTSVEKSYLLSPAGSTCSTAAPPTPASTFATTPVAAPELSWLDDDDDDEIMRGMPLWSYNGPSLEKVLQALEEHASTE
mmetsp:Transcript_112850/g.221284  ORF Transcript_112850/g.221284 Transcript_112850/m.221284 type:complete len:133 (-) Transcript_112850:204-602(-)